jgi:Na+/proline symporter
MFFPAMAARHFLAGLADEAQVYPLLCARLLPPGMLGLMIAAMFAATMSTLSGDYNVCANVLTADVYRRLVRPNASQKELVLAGRLTTLVVGIASIGLALLLAGSNGERQFRNMVTLFSTTAAPVAIPMLLGLTWRRATNAGVLSGFLVGITVGFVLFWRLPDEIVRFGMTFRKENLITLSTCVATVVPILLMSRLRRVSDDERERVTTFHQRLATPVGEMDEDTPSVSAMERSVLSPFRVVGICIVFIGLMLVAIQPWIEGRLPAVLNLALGGGLLVVGGVMTWTSGRRRQNLIGAE